MKKQFLLLTLLLSIRACCLSGQTSICGTTFTEVTAPPVVGNILTDGCNPITTHPIFVRIQPHIIRPTIPFPGAGVSTERVKAAIGRMSADFSKHNIFFVWDQCDIRFIDSDNYYSGDVGSLELRPGQWRA